jgi:ankyrin repeat protein
LIHIAAKYGHLEVLKYLSDVYDEKGFGFESIVNTRSADYLTPFMKALLGRHFECATYLIENGAEKDLQINESIDLAVLAYQKKLD